MLREAAAFDPELHSVLELASDAELSELSSILYGQRSISFYFSNRESDAILLMLILLLMFESLV